MSPSQTSLSLKHFLLRMSPSQTSLSETLPSWKESFSDQSLYETGTNTPPMSHCIFGQSPCLQSGPGNQHTDRGISLLPSCAVGQSTESRLVTASLSGKAWHFMIDFWLIWSATGLVAILDALRVCPATMAPTLGAKFMSQFLLSLCKEILSTGLIGLKTLTHWMSIYIMIYFTLHCEDLSTI